MNIFCVSRVLYSPPQSADQIKWFLQEYTFSPGINTGREKLANIYM